LKKRFIFIEVSKPEGSVVEPAKLRHTKHDPHPPSVQCSINPRYRAFLTNERDEAQKPGHFNKVCPDNA
jgi:hypothetical protein